MRIFVAGHKGMVGRAIVRQLQNISEVTVITRARDALDLQDQKAVQDFFFSEKIDQVYLAAAKVGGIHANSAYPAEFIYDNIMIAANIVHAAHLAGVDKLLFLGSSCIYPKFSAQPIKESELLTSPLEPTNEPYAIAKIAGIKLCESYSKQYGRDYRSIMPTNLFGQHDNFHRENSHVVPALIRRFHEAVLNNQSKITIWGSGSPLRDFLHVDDLADACIFVMNLAKCDFEKFLVTGFSHLNVGSGQDISIKELALTIATITGFEGELAFDTSKPDGTPRKLLDISNIETLGWSPKIDLSDGLQSAYDWYVQNQTNARS